MLELTLNRWNKNENIILILSSNSLNYDYSSIRKKIPQNVPILLAGIGAQGGNSEVMKHLLDDNKRGVFVNSSRGILYSYKTSSTEWKNSILNEVIKLKTELNEIRK